MTLPYSVEVFFTLMAQYNGANFPAGPLGVVLALALLLLVVQPHLLPIAGRDRMIAVLLSAAWIWVGMLHQLDMMATLNFMAPYYGFAWIVGGLLIGLSGTVFGHVRFGFPQQLRGWVGAALALFGAFGYPLIVLLLGYGWAALPLVGTAPDPTAIFTVGMLLMVRDRTPLHLLLIPLAWGGVAAASAYLLRFPLDYSVTVAVLAACALAIRQRVHRVEVTS